MGCCGGKEEGMPNEPFEARRIIALQGVMQDTDADVQQQSSAKVVSAEKSSLKWMKE